MEWSGFNILHFWVNLADLSLDNLAASQPARQTARQTLAHEYETFF